MKNCFFVAFIFFGCISLKAQIVPPGLGKIHSGSWLAFAVQQELGGKDNKDWKSVTYIGNNGVSSSVHKHPFSRQGLFVLNQEFYHRFHPRWEYSLALSYRRKNEYSQDFPLEKAQIPLKQELRWYGRVSYHFDWQKIKITPTFRQEVQHYFYDNFIPFEEKLRFRSRFRLKFAFPLDVNKIHQLLLYSEQLFSISLLENSSEKWTKFNYSDSRFTLYYSFAPKEIPWTFNLGYMNNLIGTKSTHIFALDLIWKNPFSRK